MGSGSVRKPLSHVNSDGGSVGPRSVGLKGAGATPSPMDECMSLFILTLTCEQIDEFALTYAPYSPFTLICTDLLKFVIWIWSLQRKPS